jgi:hypothetical protein
MLGVEIAVGWLDLEPEFLRETVVFECKGIGEGTRSIFAVILFFLRYPFRIYLTLFLANF